MAANLHLLISELRRLGIHLWAEGERLRCKAPKGALTSELQQQIADCKTELLEFLQKANLAAQTAPSNISRVPRDGALALSFAQERLWFLDKLEGSSVAYNMPVALCLTGHLQISALERSLNEIIRRHEILRTRFVPSADGTPVQTIDAPFRMSLAPKDVSHLPEAERELESERIFREDAQQAFDLSQSPLLRINLLQVRERDYILYMTIHHTIFDGWSAGIFVKELISFYEGFCSGKPARLPELPIQYADFAQWQHEWMQGEAFEKQLSYWKQQLSGELPLLELPIDRPRPAQRTFQGATQSFTLSRPLSRALNALSRKEGTSLFAVLLAAFNLLLFRCTGQDDIPVGFPIASRNQAELEQLIGFLVNTLVLRTDASGNPPFREFLAQVQNVILDAQASQEMPFERLVAELHPERQLNRQPLFQVMFALQNAPGQPLELPGLSIAPLETHSGMSMFDLTLEMAEDEQQLSGYFEYSTELFDGATISRLIDHFTILLQGIVEHPEQRLAEFSILSESERKRMLVDWNQTQSEYPKNACLHELFEAQAAKNPDALAVVFAEDSLTYGELLHRANQVACYLQARGAGAECIIGICMERSVEMIIGMLGILKAGSAYLPLDPNYPKERLALLLNDTAAPLLLTQQHLLDRIPEGSALKTICLDSEWPQIAACDTVFRAEVGAENLAYIIYTSGSTGIPKGVMIPHRAVVNRCVALGKYYELDEGDKVLQFASMSFDVSVEEIFSTLSSGAALVLRPNDVSLSFHELLELSEREGLSVLNLPTAYWHEWVAESTRSHLPFPSSLRLVIVGTEQASIERLADWKSLAPDRIRWINAYGPTEATITATMYELGAGQANGRTQSVSIGRPLANTEIYLLDSSLQPVPVGVTGELHIGGESLARGYLNQAALTDEKFIPNPFRPSSSAKLYKTGDLARYLPDGNIEFLGRIDHQVKIRGFRIELGEIEAALTAHASVREALVIVREDIPGYQRLVAYVLPAHEQVPDAGELRASLKETLPDYMIPADFVILEAFPLTPSGKIHRKALPAPDSVNVEHAVLPTRSVPPRTPQEKLLADIWRDVLLRDSIGIHDNFFELGGDSILSLQIVAKARQENLSITPKDIFQNQTIAELAAVAGVKSAIRAEQGIVTGAVPLTPVQHWFFEQRLPEAHHWNQALLLEVRETLDVDILKEAVRVLMNHHDALRLRFWQRDEQWEQQCLPPDDSVPFSTVDFCDVPDNERVRSIETVASELQASLDLESGPLLRVAFFTFGPESPGRVLLIVHHLAVDGISWRIILEDLQTVYQQLHQGKPVQLPQKTTSFKTWSSKLIQYARSEILAKELDYWAGLAGYPLTPLPVDYSSEKEANTVASAAHVLVSLDAEKTRQLLQEVPAVYNTQMTDVLLMALALAFSRWTGSPSLLIDLEGHGREELFEDVELSRTVGWFTSIFPFLLRCEREDRPGEFLEAVKQQRLTLPNRGIGYGLLRYLNREESVREQLHTIPQAEVSFNYLGQFDQTLSDSSLFAFARESVGPLCSPSGTRKHLIEIDGFIADGVLQMTWTYSESFHDKNTIERIARSFIKALEKIILHCVSLGVQPGAPLRREELSSTMITGQASDLWNEVRLDPEIRPVSGKFIQVADPKAIFLTGATGFLGAYLLDELLRQTHADVYCLVRAATREEGESRLRQNLATYELWDASRSERIIPVPGDLSKPLFGLSPAQFTEYATRFDVIYHNGAWANFFYPYSVLKAANVLGTQEILRLACEFRMKPVHFVSTLSLFESPAYADAKILRETAPVNFPPSDTDGYGQSKWVAEKLVLEASSRGMPICVYRPATITGHTRTGAGNTHDWFSHLIKGCIQLGKAPEVTMNFAVTPVDYVSRALVHLSMTQDAFGKVFHLTTPTPLSWNDLVRWIRSFGYPLRAIPYEQWQSVLEQLETTEDNVLTPLLAILPESADTAQTDVTVDCRNTLAGLAGTTISCPVADKGLFQRYFSYFVRTGFLHALQADNRSKA